jgi:hypothetical protein
MKFALFRGFPLGGSTSASFSRVLRLGLRPGGATRLWRPRIAPIERAIGGFSESEVYDDFWQEIARTVQSFESNCNVSNRAGDKDNNLLLAVARNAAIVPLRDDGSS